MKKSIRLKMSIWVLGSILIIVCIGLVLANLFLDDYYLATKKTATVDVYKELSDAISDDMYLTESETLLNDICEKKGVSCIVMSQGLVPIYIYGADDALGKRITEKIFDLVIKEKNVYEKTIELTDDYEINMVTDKVHNNTHIEMTGTFNGESYFIIRVAVENIQETIEITNKVIFIISIILLVTISILMLVITRSFTKPLHKLSEISKKMAALNFDVRYDEERSDEIGVLGRNMNEMSRALENIISELKAANIELKLDIDKKNHIESMRSDFLSNVSHELKTPIALIQGYAEGLKEGITDDPESMKFYCEVIVDEANKMNKIVKNLLTLNQIEFSNSNVSMERFDVVELMRGVLNAQQIRATQKDIRVEFSNDKPIYVWADEFQIEEVLSNYVSNAFNHVKGNNVIKVQIVEKDGIVRVSVFNTGDLIPENDIDNIWEKFYKVDKARTREYGGNGIGLSIVKAIAERMGKEYGVVNHADGVEFWIELDGNVEVGHNHKDERIKK